MKIDAKSKSELESLSLDIKENELTLVIDYPKYRFDDVLIISNKANEIISNDIKLAIIIQADGRNFSDEELSIFMALEKELNKLSLPLYFDGGYKDTYSLEELIKADKILDEIIDKINKSNLSPLEKYLYIYKYLSSKPYKFDQREKDPDIKEEYIHLPRDIISVTNTDYIVCQGYGELNKYLCKNVGIDVFINYLYVIDSEGAEAHLNNLVILKDDKYDISGVFYSDACWDNGGDIRTFSFALVL